MIKLKNIKIHFKGVTLQYKDYTFQTNHIHVIKGSNGTGKTTLLKAIAGLQPHTGDLEKNGVITYVSQNPVMFHMSVYDNLIYPLRIRKKEIEQYQEQLNHYIKLFHLEHILSKNATLCSSGEQMKMSIIRGIIFSPDVLLLDEPTTSLDIQSIQALTELLKKLKQHTTIIIASHDRLLIEELHDSIYELGDPYV